MRLFAEAVSQPNDQEDRDADVRGEQLFPLSTRINDGLVILPKHNNYAQRKGKQRTIGEKWGVIG